MGQGGVPAPACWPWPGTTPDPWQVTQWQFMGHIQLIALGTNLPPATCHLQGHMRLALQDKVNECRLCTVGWGGDPCLLWEAVIGLFE